MNFPAEKRDARLMRAMFGAVAPRYDLVTRVFSYGMDQRWKRLAVRRAGTSGSVVLDLACGTGDFSQMVSEAFPGARVVAVDLTLPMLSPGPPAQPRRGGLRQRDGAALCRRDV